MLQIASIFTYVDIVVKVHATHGQGALSHTAVELRVERAKRKLAECRSVPKQHIEDELEKNQRISGVTSRNGVLQGPRAAQTRARVRAQYDGLENVPLLAQKVLKRQAETSKSHTVGGAFVSEPSNGGASGSHSNVVRSMSLIHYSQQRKWEARMSQSGMVSNPSGGKQSGGGARRDHAGTVSSKLFVQHTHQHQCHQRQQQASFQFRDPEKTYAKATANLLQVAGVPGSTSTHSSAADVQPFDPKPRGQPYAGTPLYVPGFQTDGDMTWQAWLEQCLLLQS